MAASASPTSRVARARTCDTLRRTAAIDSVSPLHSTAGSPASIPVRSIGASRGDHAGPMPTPGDVGIGAIPIPTPPPAAEAAGAALGIPVGAAGAAGPSSGSSKLRAASSSRWSSAARAWLPPALTSTSWPDRTPSVATFDRLPACTHADPVVRLRMSTRASNARTACTTRAAGRACSPCGLATVKAPVSSSAGRRRVGCRPAARARPGGTSCPRGRPPPPPPPRRGRATGGRGHRRDDQPLDQRGRAEHDPVPHVVVEQLQRELGREHGAAEVHQHHDALPLVGGLDGRHDLGGVGAERGVVQPRRHLHAHRLAVQHLPSQGDRRVGERPAVRDHHQPGARRHQPAPTAAAAASRSRVVEVAPGSWCPTLRSPR